MQMSIGAPNSPANNQPFALRFLMWLYIVSMSMIFAGFTSAMIVSMNDNMANNSWLHFTMPHTFALSTFFALASSGTLWWAYRAAKRDLHKQLTASLLASLVLGILFLMTQYIGFGELYEMGVRFVDNSADIGTRVQVNNASGSYFMILTGAHAAHIVAGILVLLVQIFRAMMYRITSRNLLGLHLAAIFWHALTFVWIYLFIFLSVVYN